MSRNGKDKPAATNFDRGFAFQLFAKGAVLVICMLVFLALVSNHPTDIFVLQGGIGDYEPIHNWIGRAGALVSSKLLLVFGFAAYPAILLMLLCVLSRLFNRDNHPITVWYYVGILSFLLGGSMLLGVFPEFFPSWQRHYNMSELPGGVIGQCLCAPGTEAYKPGWLNYIVNEVGCIIISGALLVLGLVAVWYYDWWIQTKRFWANLKNWQIDRFEAAAENRRARDEEPEPDDEPEPEPEPAVAKAGTRSSDVEPEPDHDDDDDDYYEPEPEPEPAPAPPAAPGPMPTAPDPVAPPARPQPIVSAPPPRTNPNYKLPPPKLLEEVDESSAESPRDIERKKQILQQTFESFGIDAEVGDATCGPRVTLYEIRPAPGVKVERISNLANNISMNLKAESLRILTPIPGKDTVGIEAPNSVSSNVSLRALLESSAWTGTRAAIPIALGKDISGKPVILDLARAPHLMIAGATGSGKSVCINTLILSLLLRFSPDQLKLILVDPKVVEFSGYGTLPHLVTPVVTDVKKVPIALRWVINQMEWRYQILSKVGARNIATYNSRQLPDTPVLDDDGNPIPDRLPFLVIIIDELADIMMTAKADVETSLARIAQLARAVGIHAVIATQRPSVNIITGVIKANFPTRIAFQVSSLPDSRTILDTKGAESLLGRGDMLFKAPGGAKLARVQGAMVGDEEIETVVKFCSAQAEPDFAPDVFQSAKEKEEGAVGGVQVSGFGSEHGPSIIPAEDDEEGQIQAAIQIILRDRRATTSHLQRRMRIGYNRASIIIEELERRGIVGPQIGQNPREILITGDPDPDTDDDDIDES